MTIVTGRGELKQIEEEVKEGKIEKQIHIVSSEQC